MSAIVTVKLSGDTNVFTNALKERADEFRKRRPVCVAT